MTDRPPGFYRPTQEEFKFLWDNGLIIVDTNALLDLYRMKNTTSTELLRTLRSFERQLWLPHQVELEFQKNRTDVIIEQKEKYSQVLAIVARNKSTTSKTLSDQLSKYSRHPFIDVENIEGKVNQVFDTAITELKVLEICHPDYLQNDPIFDEVYRLFKRKIGDPYSETRIKEIYQEGEERYRKKIPPGYEDADKAKRGDNSEYGDLVVWFQIIDKAREIKKPVILVTSEKKSDWWEIKNGHKTGPKAELVEEMREKAGVLFYAYPIDRFIQFAQERLDQPVNQDVITELREIRSSEEIAEARRDEEVRIEANRDSFVIGKSVEVFGYAYTNDSYVRLLLYGPGEYSEGVEIATPEITDKNRWSYQWDPGFTIPPGVYTFVVYDAARRISDEVPVRAEKGAITLVAHGAQSYYIGEKVKLSGTSTASTKVFLAIRGTTSPHARKLDDYPVITEDNNPETFVEVKVRSDCTWSYILDTTLIGKYLVPGIYTIYAIEAPLTSKNIEGKAYSTVSVIIKSPFVRGTVSQSIIAQGDQLVINGTAEGTPQQTIQIWIFGSSFTCQKIIHANADSSFSLTLPTSLTRELAVGEYIGIIQHPMLNNTFDVYLDETKKRIVTNYPEPGTVVASLDGPDSLHGLDAANAVVDAINNPNIDDTYTKFRFFVETPCLRIDAIPDRYIGDKFTITGQTNLAVDSEIIVEVYSSSYDPTQKVQAGEFSGATGTVKVLKGDSGYNQFTFDIDSSTFVPGDYIVKALAITSDIAVSTNFTLRERWIRSDIFSRIFRFLK